MKDRQHIGIVVKCLSNEIGRAASAVAANELGDSATGLQSWVVRYLYDNREREVFQKDLEAHFSVRRSTMTTILKLMEKNGMITKESVDRDARLKRLVLTPSAVEMQKRIRRGIDSLEERMKN
ncbi:MAG: MarR family transcriptional regulator, partial [Clostridia bacterium]|nr:MarR family transcriptional regulator [Clostridia bacterium]